MEDKEYALDILLHYYLNEEGKHTMDAFTYNKCEKQLLDALRGCVKSSKLPSI